MDTGRRQAKVGLVDPFPLDKSCSQDQTVRGPLINIYIHIGLNAKGERGIHREEKGPGVNTACEARSESSGLGHCRTPGAAPAPICGRPCARVSLSLFIAADYK